MWHKPRAVLLNTKPSRLPINCSRYSAPLGMNQSTSLYDCCQWLHIVVMMRQTRTEPQHRREEENKLGAKWLRSSPFACHPCFFPQLWGQGQCWTYIMLDQKALCYHCVNAPPLPTHCTIWTLIVTEVICTRSWMLDWDELSWWNLIGTPYPLLILTVNHGDLL